MPTGHPIQLNMNNVIELYSEGNSTRYIASLFNTNHTTIQSRLRESGIILRDKSSSQIGKPRYYGVKSLVSKPCQGCGEDIFAKPGQIDRVSAFCSKSCKIVNKPEIQTVKQSFALNCEECGAVYFVEWLYEIKKRRFCSHPCSLQWNAKNLTGGTKIERTVTGWLEDLNVSFQTQAQIGGFFADFLLEDISLVIEADGDYWHSLPHIIQRDIMRNVMMRRWGFTVLRFSETDINNDPVGCQQKIKETILGCSSPPIQKRSPCLI